MARLERATTLDDNQGQLARLQRSGLVKVGRGQAATALASWKRLKPKGNVSAVDIIIEERRSGL